MNYVSDSGVVGTKMDISRAERAVDIDCLVEKGQNPGRLCIMGRLHFGLWRSGEEFYETNPVPLTL